MFISKLFFSCLEKDVNSPSFQPTLKRAAFLSLTVERVHLADVNAGVTDLFAKLIHAEAHASQALLSLVVAVGFAPEQFAHDVQFSIILKVTCAITRHFGSDMGGETVDFVTFTCHAFADRSMALDRGIRSVSFAFWDESTEESS